MLTVKKKSRSKYSDTTAPQSEFAALQNAIRRLQKSNQGLQDDLQKLAQYYQEHILPREKDLVLPIKRLIERLVALYPRKALARWQRQELTDWILDEIQHLAMLDAEAAQEMMSAFQTVMVELFELSEEDIAEMRAQSEGEMQYPDEDMNDQGDLFEELLHATAQSHQHAQGHLFSEEDDEERIHDRAATTKSAATINPDDWIKQLFRRAASVLHPDRERDPVVREQKHHLMSMLIGARERGDIMAMLTLFNDHVAASDVGFSAEEYSALIQLLRRQLQDLRADKHSIIHTSPFHAFIYHNLYSKQKTKRDLKIKAYMETLENQSRELTAMTQELRNVKSLQSLLKARVGYDVEFEVWF